MNKRTPLPNLLLFNMKTDASDDVLGFTTDWVNALAIHFSKITVITMSAGALKLAPNVKVHSVGKEKGYSEPKRFFEFYRLLLKTLKKERFGACFVHMIPLFAVLGWPLLALKRIPIVLWYGHRATPFLLKVAHRLVDLVVTSTPAGFRLESEKKRVIGQGITEAKFPFRPFVHRNNPVKILSVARISAIKNIDLMVEAIARLVEKKGENFIRLVLVGDTLSTDDIDYKKNLQKKILDYGLVQVFDFVGSVPYPMVPTVSKTVDLGINLAPHGAIDKAALEMLAMGIPVIVQNTSFSEIFEKAGVDPKRFVAESGTAKEIANKIEGWITSDERSDHQIMQKVSKIVVSDHGLANLARKISSLIFQLIARQNKIEEC